MISKHVQIGILPFLRRTVAAQTHLLALIFAIVGAVLLVEKCQHQPLNQLVAVVIFGLTSIFLFAVSCLYHFLYDGFQMSKGLEGAFEKLDHIAIYLFIAGTYTPVLLNAVSDRWANFLLVVVWSIAFFGSVYTLFKHRLATWAQHRYAYTTLFVLMGWVFLVRLNEILHTLSHGSVRNLLFGGFCYFIGAGIYAVRWPNLVKDVFGFHELWHVFVLFGYIFHYQLISGFY